jgi:hypothetical protein
MSSVPAGRKQISEAAFTAQSPQKQSKHWKVDEPAASEDSSASEGLVPVHLNTNNE